MIGCCHTDRFLGNGHKQWNFFFLKGSSTNRTGGPNWVLSYDPHGPARYFIRKRKKIPFRAVRVEVIGPGKRVVKLETRTPRKIDAI